VLPAVGALTCAGAGAGAGAGNCWASRTSTSREGHW
jgi:hypothetical protein